MGSPSKRQCIRLEPPQDALGVMVKSDQSLFVPRALSVPLDIMLLVLDAVRDLEPSSDAQKTLCLCARSCRAMLKPSQVRLYAEVTITKRPEFEGFGRALRENMELAPLVKTLSVDVGPAYYDVPLLQKPGFPLSSWVIGRMTSLRKLTLCGLRPPNKLFPNRQRDSPVLDALLGWFAVGCPKLKVLRLREMHFDEYAGFVRHVASFPALETLMVCALTWTRRGHVTEGEIRRHASSSTLRSLQISLRPRHYTYWDFTQASWGISVHSLTLRLSHQTLSDRQFTGLAAFWELAHLELHLANNDVRSVAVALRHITSKHMKTIRVSHICSAVVDNMPTLYASLGVDEILAGPTYKSLTKVTWCLVSNRGEAQVWLASLPRYFAGLARRKILVGEWRFGNPRTDMAQRSLDVYRA